MKKCEHRVTNVRRSELKAEDRLEEQERHGGMCKRTWQNLRLETECYEQEVQPYQKTDYKPIITGLSTDLLLQLWSPYIS